MPMNHVLLVIDVTIKVMTINEANVGFLGDQVQWPVELTIKRDGHWKGAPLPPLPIA